ncbi:MAG: hypothetical protein SGBAC_005048 [Bacillariaceae sp.]
MLSKLGPISRSAFSEKESLIASEALNDGDDIFITESFQPGEENSSVMGNSSIVGHIEAPAMPFENDKDIYAEPSDRTIASTSTDSSRTQPVPEGRLPLPQTKFTRTMPKRDQLSKLTDDMPWTLYGNETVSRLANDALDAGDDIHISASSEQDDFSVIGNSSVAPYDDQSTVGETDEDNFTPATTTQMGKPKKGLFRKLSLTKRITRILPSKQYVSKLSKLAEDAPWNLNSQEQISKQADQTLNDGDDLFISKSFEPLEADTSSVLGNLSYVSATKSTLGSGASAEEKRDDIPVYEAFLEKGTRAMNEPTVARAGIRKRPVTDKFKNAISTPVTDTLKSAMPVAEKLKSAIPTPVTEKLRSVPGNVVSTSQKLIPWRLKTKVKSEYRTPLVSEHQEISDDTSDSARDIILPSNYHIGTPESAKELHPLKESKQRSSTKGGEIAFSLSTDTESSRSRSLTWDNASCSDMSEITEPSIYSRSRSFRKMHSMYIIEAKESLLGSADEDSEVGTVEDGSSDSSSNTRGSRLIHSTGDRSMTKLPNINESKTFNAMSSTDMFSPSVVNNFLNRMESIEKPINDKRDKSWDAPSILNNGECQEHAPVSDNHGSANRHRVFSDSDAVFEFQRQRSVQDIDEAPNQCMPGALKDLQEDDSFTLFLDNGDSTDESDASARPEIETTDQETPPFQTQVVFHDSNFSAHLLHSKDENDFWKSTKGSSDKSIRDSADAVWSQGPHFPSNPISISGDSAKQNTGFDAEDAPWSQRRRFTSDSFAFSNPTENIVDVNDDLMWSPRQRFNSDSEAIIHHSAEISIENFADAHVIDAMWNQQPRFATDASVIDDPTAKHTSNFEGADFSWSHDPFASDPAEIFVSSVANALGEKTVDVDSVGSSWEFSNDSKATNDDEAGLTRDAAASTDALWSQRPLYGNDPDVIDDGPAANSSSEDVIAIEEKHSDTDSSWGKEATFESDDMVGNKDATDHTFDVDPDSSWTQRPRFDDDATAHSPTEKTIDVDAAPDASWTSRPRFSSDPVVVTGGASDNAIDDTGNSSSSLRPLVSSNSVTSNKDVGEKTSVQVDYDSSGDERPRYLSTSLAINDETANSEIEISLHGEASLSSLNWFTAQVDETSSTLETMTLAEVEPEESATKRASPETNVHDYYWTQASHSEDEAEEILLPVGKSDSFDDIL